MEVKGVSNNSFFINSVKNQKNEAPAVAQQKDKIEISAEAREIKPGDLDFKKVEEIRQKISSGFYNSDAVLQKVAEKIAIDIKI